MISRRGVAALAALFVGGVVAACTAATPSPVRPTASTNTGSPRLVVPVPSAPVPTQRAARPSPNRLELEIGQVDPAWVWPMLDFASDSSAVIYSSGVADHPAGDTAPDLWRYVPGARGPELLWRNPDRDRQLAKVAGDSDVWAFAEISSLGERWWKLWVLTQPGGKPMLLDSHAGDADIPSLVPSFDVDAGRVAWTSFGRGASGAAVTRLLIAEAPGWERRVIAEAVASERAYWLPSLRGQRLAYVDVAIGADASRDVRHVMLQDLLPGAPPAIQLDVSGNATMPVLTDDEVIWKEPDAGFAMFNWGRLFRYSFADEKVSSVRTGPQQYVNYPSGGDRFVAMWGADALTFAVHDLERGASRLIATYDNRMDSIVRPHLAGDLLVWLHSKDGGLASGPPPPIEYAWLPEPGSDRADAQP